MEYTYTLVQQDNESLFSIYWNDADGSGSLQIDCPWAYSPTAQAIAAAAPANINGERGISRDQMEAVAAEVAEQCEIRFCESRGYDRAEFQAFKRWQADGNGGVSFDEWRARR